VRKNCGLHRFILLLNFTGKGAAIYRSTFRALLRAPPPAFSRALHYIFQKLSLASYSYFSIKLEFNPVQKGNIFWVASVVILGF
jgi:hypothetical protein